MATWQHRPRSAIQYQQEPAPQRLLHLPVFTQNLPAGAILAGGYVRDLLRGAEPRDVDLWFTSWEAYEETANYLQKHGATRRVSNHNRRFYASAEEVIDRFDFTVNQFAVQGGVLYYNPKSFEHLKQMRLVPAVRPLGAYWHDLRRVERLKAKGFTPDPEVVEEVARHEVERKRLFEELRAKKKET